LFIIFQAAESSFSLVPVGMTVLATHALGIIVLSSPQALSVIGLEFGMSTDSSIYMGYFILTSSMLILPAFCRK